MTHIESTDPRLVRRARRTVARRIGLAWHAAVFVAVNLALVGINLVYSPEVLWFLWPLAAWGFGLALHAVSALTGGSVDAMVEREVVRELHRSA